MTAGPVIKENAETASAGFTLKELALAVIIVLMPNLVMGGVAAWVGVSRPVINFDYVVIAFLMIVLPRIFLLAAFIVAFGVDVLGIVRQLVPVLNVQDSLYLLEFIHIAPLTYQLAFAFTLAVMLTLSLFYWKAKSFAPNHAVLLVVNVFVLAYVAFLTVDTGGNDNYRSVQAKPMASQAMTAYRASRNPFLERFSEQEGAVFSEKPVFGMTEHWFNRPEVVSDKVFLVVSESWGATDERIQESVLEPLLANQGKITDLAYGVMPFSGITVGGELRELCGLAPIRINLQGVEEGFEGCLPNEYKRLGYETLSLHGAVGSMYGRADWYPRLGFDQSIFFESKRWANRCYSFPGACDDELLEEAQSFFQDKEKAFVYHLTLNTHAPYDLRDLEKEGLDCVAAGVEVGTQSCRNLKLHHQFFSNLAGLAEREGMSGVNVLVVGDHQPLITSETEMEKYFLESKVSWVSFRIR